MHGSLSFLHLSSPLCSTSHLAMSVIKSLWRSNMSSWQFWKSSKGKRNENGLNIKPVDISQHSLCDLLPHLQSDHICFSVTGEGSMTKVYTLSHSTELERFLSWGMAHCKNRPWQQITWSCTIMQLLRCQFGRKSHHQGEINCLFSVTLTEYSVY